MAESFDPFVYPDRLNLGSGWDNREGFLNVDIHEVHKPDVVADVTELPGFPEGHYREILAQDVLEHLPRQATTDVLRRWSGLLAPGGVLRLRVPSVLGIAALLQEPERQTIEAQETLVQCLFGTQAYTEDCHYTTFTEPLLRHYLAESGLTVADWSIRDGWLFVVDAVKPPAQTPRPAADGKFDRLTRRLTGRR
jgi:predicted SAM-dependent methyltransferase